MVLIDSISFVFNSNIRNHCFLIRNNNTFIRDAEYDIAVAIKGEAYG